MPGTAAVSRPTCDSDILQTGTRARLVGIAIELHYIRKQTSKSYDDSQRGMFNIFHPSTLTPNNVTISYGVCT